MLMNSKKAKKLLLQFVPMFATFWLKCPGIVVDKDDNGRFSLERVKRIPIIYLVYSFSYM